MAALAAVPSEVTSATQALALGALQLIAAAGTALDRTAAANVLSGVSGVANAVRFGNSLNNSTGGGDSSTDGGTPVVTPADPKFGQMLLIASALAASLSGGQTVPGEEAVTVNSATVQARKSASPLLAPTRASSSLHGAQKCVSLRTHSTASRADSRPARVPRHKQLPPRVAPLGAGLAVCPQPGPGGTPRQPRPSPARRIRGAQAASALLRYVIAQG